MKKPYLESLTGLNIMDAMRPLLEGTITDTADKFSKPGKGNSKSDKGTPAEKGEDGKIPKDKEDGKNPGGKQPGKQPGKAPQQPKQPGQNKSSYPDRPAGGDGPGRPRPEKEDDNPPGPTGDGPNPPGPTGDGPVTPRGPTGDGPVTQEHIPNVNADDIIDKAIQAQKEEDRKIEREGGRGHHDIEGQKTSFDAPFKSASDFGSIRDAMTAAMPSPEYVETYKDPKYKLNSNRPDLTATSVDLSRNVAGLGNKAGAVMVYKENVKKKTGATIIFDCSGSMTGRNNILGIPNYLVAGIALQEIVKNLGTEADFDVIFFSSGPTPLLPNAGGGPVEGDPYRLKDWKSSDGTMKVDGVTYSMGGYGLRLSMSELRTKGEAGLAQYINKGAQFGCGGTMLGESISCARRWNQTNPLVFLSDMDTTGGDTLTTVSDTDLKDQGLTDAALDATVTYKVDGVDKDFKFKFQKGAGIIIDVTGNKDYLRNPEIIVNAYEKIPKRIKSFMQIPGKPVEESVKERVSRGADQGILASAAEYQKMNMGSGVFKDKIQNACKFVPVEFVIQDIKRQQ